MSARFYYKDGETVKGPVPAEELLPLPPETLICPEDGEDWVPLAEAELPADETPSTGNLVGSLLPLVLVVGISAWLYVAQKDTLVILEPAALHFAVKLSWSVYPLMALILFRFLRLPAALLWLYLALGVAAAVWMTAALPDNA